MSDALIASLQKRLDELTGENATLKSEAKDRRIKGRTLAQELEAIKAERDGLAAERDTYKTKAEAGPAELTSRIAELEGSIRTRDHRDAFASVKEFEVKGDDGKPLKYTLAPGASIEDVWHFTGYKPEGDRPEAASINEQLGKALATKPLLFAEVKPADAGTTAPRGATQPIALNRREGGPGAGKGVNDSSTQRPGGMPAVSHRDGIPGKI